MNVIRRAFQQQRITNAQGHGLQFRADVGAAAVHG